MREDDNLCILIVCNNKFQYNQFINTYSYRTIIEKDEDGYHGFVPLLKGLHTWGKTVKETKKNLEEAIQVHLEGLLKDGIKPPKQQELLKRFKP